MNATLRRVRLLCALAALSPGVFGGVVTSLTDAGTSTPVIAGITSIQKNATYQVSFTQSVGDPLIQDLHFPLPPGSGTVTVTAPGGGGDILIDTTSLGVNWTVSNAGGYVNIFDPVGPGIAGGTFQMAFTRVPPGTELNYAHITFSDNGLEMPSANPIAATPGDELRVPALVPNRNYNRIQLDNGGDFLVFLNEPTVGCDPVSGDYDGDLYTKVIPKQVLRHAKGTMDLNAISYLLFDQDWDQDDATLWAYSLSIGVDSGDVGGSGTNPGNIEPDFTDPNLIVVPEMPSVGLGNPLGFGNCPTPGELAGWEITETFVDPNTGQPIPLQVLTADGTTDYVFTHFFPDNQSFFNGGLSCASNGNMSLSFFESDDFCCNLGEGENQTDWLGTGYSAYGATRRSGAAFIAENTNQTAQVRFFFQEPTLNMYVDTGLDGGLEEMGLAGLNLPLGVDGLGVPTGDTARLGLRLYSDNAAPSSPGASPDHVGLVWATIGAPLAAPGAPIFGTCLMLNPADPIFGSSGEGWGFAFFNGFDNDADPDVDETYFTTFMPTLSPSIDLVGVTLHAQGFDFLASPLQAESTQVVSFTLRAND